MNIWINFYSLWTISDRYGFAYSRRVDVKLAGNIHLA